MALPPPRYAPVAAGPSRTRLRDMVQQQLAHFGCGSCENAVANIYDCYMCDGRLSGNKIHYIIHYYQFRSCYASL